MQGGVNRLERLGKGRTPSHPSRFGFDVVETDLKLECLKREKPTLLRSPERTIVRTEYSFADATLRADRARSHRGVKSVSGVTRRQ